MKYQELLYPSLQKQAENIVVNILNKRANFALHEEHYSTTDPCVQKVLMVAEFEVGVNEDTHEQYIKNAMFEVE